MPNQAARILPRVAIVGGGISGLATAFYLGRARKGGAAVEEFLFEGSSRLGGVLRTEQLAGCLVEAGADSFLSEKKEALELCRELGLDGQVIGSENHQRRTWILHRGELVPLPDGFEFFVPVRPWAVARTRLLSWKDKLRMLREPWVRALNPSQDESVASFVERHFGRGLVETIVDPLLNGVYGGDAERLSMRSVLPRMVEMEARWGSLLRGMRAARKQRAGSVKRNPRPPLFSALQQGFNQLVAVLSERLPSERTFCQQVVAAVERTGTGYRLHCSQKSPVDVDALVLALPAWGAARLLSGLDTELAGQLESIPYASSMIVALVYDKDAAAHLPAGFGFLVPKREGRRLRACTFVGQKFRHRVPPDRALLRCFLGGVRDEAVLDLSDEEALALVQRELQSILGLSAVPRAAKVFRWRKAMAQYTVGHGDRLRIIEESLRRHPGLFLAGNGYRGIGVPDCIRSGREAAEACVQFLQAGGG